MAITTTKEQNNVTVKPPTNNMNKRNVSNVSPAKSTASQQSSHSASSSSSSRSSRSSKKNKIAPIHLSEKSKKYLDIKSIRDSFLIKRDNKSSLHDVASIKTELTKKIA